MQNFSRFDGNPDIEKIVTAFAKLERGSRNTNFFGILLLAIELLLQNFLTVDPRITYALFGAIALILLCNLFWISIAKSFVRRAGDPYDPDQN